MRSFSIGKASQTITFAAPADRTYGDADFDPGATASTGFTVSYQTTGDCSVTPAEKIHINGAGSCTVTATQGGDTDYNPAADVVRTFSIGKGAQVISIATSAPSSAVYGTGSRSRRRVAVRVTRSRTARPVRARTAARTSR
jgi:hypothetical protein